MGRNFISQFFYKGKHIKNENRDSLNSLLLPSVLSIILCAVCLMGTTLAWFSAVKTTDTQTIMAAKYSADVYITEIAETAVAAKIETATTQTYLSPDASGAYSLVAGKTYSVSITASGTAKTGFFIVEYADQNLHTPQISKGSTFTFILVANEAATLKITAQWGTSAKTEEEKLTADTVLTYGETPTCSCTVKCTETEANAECTVCKADISACIGTEAAQPETPATEPTTEGTKETATLPDTSADDVNTSSTETTPTEEQDEPTGEQNAENTEETAPSETSAEEATDTEETQAPAEQESTTPADTAAVVSEETDSTEQTAENTEGTQE